MPLGGRQGQRVSRGGPRCRGGFWPAVLNTPLSGRFPPHWAKPRRDPRSRPGAWRGRSLRPFPPVECPPLSLSPASASLEESGARRHSTASPRRRVPTGVAAASRPTPLRRGAGVRDGRGVGARRETQRPLRSFRRTSDLGAADPFSADAQEMPSLTVADPNGHCHCADDQTETGGAWVSQVSHRKPFLCRLCRLVYVVCAVCALVPFVSSVPFVPFVPFASRCVLFGPFGSFLVVFGSFGSFGPFTQPIVCCPLFVPMRVSSCEPSRLLDLERTPRWSIFPRFWCLPEVYT